jgi:hypothetical protein
VNTWQGVDSVDTHAVFHAPAVRNIRRTPRFTLERSRVRLGVQRESRPYDPPVRRGRRRTAPIVGTVGGAIAGLVVAGIVDLVGSDVSPIVYLGGALLGAVAGFVLALLVPAELDDGDDDLHALVAEHGGVPGRADAPLRGAHAKDRE